MRIKEKFKKSANTLYLEKSLRYLVSRGYQSYECYNYLIRNGYEEHVDYDDRNRAFGFRW